MIRLFLIAAAALGAAVVLPAAAAPAPKMAIASFDQLAQPLPLPYDTKANAVAQVAAAKARALAGHKLLLIDLGGNWCLDCRILAGTIAQPALKAFVARHYELVAVDIGRMDKNLAIPARYGITRRLEGVPALLVIDPLTDTLIDTERLWSLADARHMTPQGIADWLAQWVR